MSLSALQMTKKGFGNNVDPDKTAHYKYEASHQELQCLHPPPFFSFNFVTVLLFAILFSSFVLKTLFETMGLSEAFIRAFQG